MIHIIFEIIRAVLGLLSLVLIVYVVISWLYAFDVVSRRNAILGSIWEFCRAVTDPLVRPLRRLIPPIAGVDLSVMVLLLVVYLLQTDVSWWLERLLLGQGGIL
jgi:YggT family protein